MVWLAPRRSWPLGSASGLNNCSISCIRVSSSSAAGCSRRPSLLSWSLGCTRSNSGVASWRSSSCNDWETAPLLRQSSLAAPPRLPWRAMVANTLSCCRVSFMSFDFPKRLVQFI
ncbi:hypothetical protein D3C72_1297680 [compost metagenome]